ncbi:MAG: beta strand repeat-containing protein, partial [Burkholderiales bacterium]
TSITQAATSKIIANTLGMMAGGAIDVNTATNNVGTLGAATTAGTIKYQDADALTLANVATNGGNFAGITATNAISSNNANVDIKTASATTGTLNLTNDVNAGTGNVYLTTGTSITQAATSKIIANTLGMMAGGAIDVNTATNNVGTLGAAATAGTIKYQDADALTLANVATNGGNFTGITATNAISTSNANVDIKTASATTGTLNVTNDVNAATGNVYLTTGTSITQAATSKIIANTLGMMAGGAIDVNTATNNVGTLGAATTAGTIKYQDADALTLANVGSNGGNFTGITATNAISTNNANVDIKTASATAGTLNLTNDVNAGTGNVYLTSGTSITQAATSKVIANTLGMVAGGGINVNTATNDVNTMGATTTAGSITFQDADDVTLANIPTNGGNFTGVTAARSLDSASAITLTTGSTLNINDDITAASHITQLGGPVVIAGTAGIRTLNANDGDVSFAGSITSNQPFTINAGAQGNGTNGRITIANGMNSNSNPIEFNGTDWDFTASAAGSINANTSTLTIAHSRNGTINLVASGAGLGAGLLGTDDLARITTAATGTLYVGDATKTDSVNVGGNVDFAVSTPNAEIRAASLTNAAGRIGTQNVASHLLTISTTTGTTTNVIGNAGTANLAVHNSGVGNITLNAASGNLNITRAGPAGAGTGTAVDNAGGVIDIAVQSGTLTTEASGGGMLATGNITARAHSGITVNDAINASSGNVKLVAGRATGMGNVGEAAWGTGGFQLGPININAPIRSGYATMNGNINLYSTGPILQSTTADAGIQAFHADSLSQGNLTGITFNDGAQVATITLENNKTSPANPVGIGGCGVPAVAGTGNCVGPLTLETRLSAGQVPPNAPYAASDIKYKSINGTTIFGIGTAASIQFISPSQNISTGSINGKDVFFYATAGDVNLNVQITNKDINAGQSGGSLNLRAAGNININAPTDAAKQGVAVGKVLSISADGVVTAEQFDHDLKLVSTGDIVVNGSIYMKGDLTLRANANVSEVNPSNPNAAPQAGGGSGKVVLTTQPISFYTGGAPTATSFPLEVKAKNIVIGTKDGATPQPVAGLILNASGPAASTTPGLAQRADAVIEATGKLEVYVSGDIEMTGGNAVAITTGPTMKSTAVTALVADEMFIKGMGVDNKSNFKITAGTAITDTSRGGGAIASADAFLFSGTKKEIDIGGTLTLTGGVTPNFGQSTASAKIDPTELIIRTGGDIVMIGGSGKNSSAGIINSGDISLFIGGAGTNRVITFISSSSPSVSAGGSLSASAGTFNSVTIPGGLIMIGGPGTGLFGASNVPISLGDQIKGSFSAGGTISTVIHPSLSSAFITANSPRAYDGLLGYIIYAANEETRAARVRAGLGASDDSNSPSCN